MSDPTAALRDRLIAICERAFVPEKHVSTNPFHWLLSSRASVGR
jgi:hypothetical protein